MERQKLKQTKGIFFVEGILSSLIDLLRLEETRESEFLLVFEFPVGSQSDSEAKKVLLQQGVKMA